MTPSSKRMRSVSVNNYSIDFTKYGTTDGSFAKDRVASVKLGGGSAGSASVRSCNSPILHNAAVPALQCRHLALLLGLVRPWPRDARTSPPVAARSHLSAPRPARCELEAIQDPMPIRFQLQELVPQSIPAVRGQPPVARPTQTSRCELQRTT